jgi:predicted dinucleotide-binding enzyme
VAVAPRRRQRHDRPKTLAEAIKADIVFWAVGFESHRDVAKALPTWQGKTIIDVRRPRRSGNHRSPTR